MVWFKVHRSCHRELDSRLYTGHPLVRKVGQLQIYLSLSSYLIFNPNLNYGHLVIVLCYLGICCKLNNLLLFSVRKKRGELKQPLKILDECSVYCYVNPMPVYISANPHSVLLNTSNSCKLTNTIIIKYSPN